MKIQYWGTAAAEGVPGAFCACDACREARALGGRYIRTRSQLLVNGDLLIDFGADTYAHSLRYGFDLSALEHAVITHVHSDHFYPSELTNRREGFAHGMAPTLTVHGSEDIIESVTRRAAWECDFENQSRVAFDIMRPFETESIGRYRITPLPARHGTKNPFVYLISEGDTHFLLLNDTGRPQSRVYEWLKEQGIRLACVSFDCTYGYVNLVEKYGDADHHMGLLDNAAVRDELKSRGLLTPDAVCIATHFSHNAKDVSYGKMLEHTDRLGFLLAYDGMTVEF